MPRITQPSFIVPKSSGSQNKYQSRLPDFRRIKFQFAPQPARYHLVERALPKNQDTTRDVMPDYEIRLFHADGSLAVVHVSSHASEEEAAKHARLLVRDHARYEVRVGGKVVAQDRRR
jgi:hypothetical protein